MSAYDAIIIGAGHNGLVCAAYLARAGLKTLVLEKSHLVGGCATTVEIFPGFHFNLGAHLSVFFQEKVTHDLDLERFGLEKILLDPQMFVPYPDGRYLLWYNDLDRSCAAIARQFSERDAAGFRQALLFWRTFGETIRPVILQPPPSIGQMLAAFSGGPAENAARQALFYSCQEFYGPLVPSPELQSFFAFLGVNGTMAGPMTPGSNFICGFHLMLDDPWYYIRGGTGRLTAALAESLRAGGGVLRTRAPVERILVRGGRVAGVRCQGEEIPAGIVVSGTDPQATFLTLLDESDLPPDFRQAVQGIKNRPVYAQVFFALAELPDYTCLPGQEPGPQHAPTLFAPSADYIERAWDDCKYGRPSRDPVVFMSIPSAKDPALAPPGQHAASAYVMYVPYAPVEGEWRTIKHRIAERVIDLVSEYAPNFRHAVLHSKVWVARDYEQVLGLTRGNFWHTDITVDQMFSFRPVPGWSDYHTPVPGLYLCGAGTHPGGGLSGAPGHNAAQSILADRQVCS